MAAKRGKSQARRNSGNRSGGLPGWAWLVLGVVLTVLVVLAVPKFFHGDGGDGFFRPKPIRSMWKRHLSGQMDEQYRLWGVLMFQCWLQLNDFASPREEARVLALAN